MAARVAAQSIHITTTPMPRSLTESKQILSALQKFGEVVTFRNLKYDTTNTSQNPTSRSIIAIFESPSSASQAIAASPLTIPLVKPPPSQPQSQSHLPPREPGTPSPDPWASSENAAVQSHITCTIQPSRHNHESALRRNPFHSLFRVDGKSWQAKDLVRTGIPLRELADVPMARKGHEPFRVKRKVQAENERLGATSLMALYEEGLRGKMKGMGLLLGRGRLRVRRRRWTEDELVWFCALRFIWIVVGWLGQCDMRMHMRVRIRMLCWSCCARYCVAIQGG